MNEPLKDRLHLLSLVVDQTSDGIAVVELVGTLIYVNTAFARMHGFEPEELLGKHLSVFHSEEQMPAVNEATRQIEETGLFEGEIWHIRRDGEPFLTYMRNSVLHDSDGKVIGIIGTMIDITKQKLAEKELRESERRFDLVVQATSDGVWEWNVITNVEYFAPRWCEIIGYSHDDPELLHTYDFWASRIHPDDYDRVMLAMKAHLEEGEIYDVDYRHRHKSGEYRWQNSRGKAVFDDHGKPVRMVGCIRDITDRKRAKEALQESEEKHRTLLETNPYGFTVIDLSGNITYTNPAHHKMLGYSKEELLGKSCLDLLDTDEARDQLRAYLSTLVKNQPEPTTYEQRNRTKDGRIIDQLVDWNYRRDNEGRLVGFASVITDVTERKRAEEKVEFLSQVTEQVTDSIITTDLNFKITYVNLAFQKLYGYSKEEIIGQSPGMMNVSPDADGIQAEIYRTVSNGEVWRGEAQNRTKDGLDFPCELTIYPIVDDNGQVFAYAGSQRDITERKLAEEKLQKTAQELKARQKELIDKNAALTEILDNIEQQRRDYKHQICRELEQELLPVIQRARRGSRAIPEKAVIGLESSMRAILSKDVDVFKGYLSKLTPRELQVCDLLRQGKTSKEIADQLNLSPVTVNTHRQRIRKKLGITNKSLNLSTLLRMY